MPTYVFVRDDGVRVERFFPISKRPKRIKCPDGKWARFSLAATLQDSQIGASGDVKYARVQWSDACGVHPNSIPRRVKKNPHHLYCPRTGRMGFTSKSHRERCLRDIGFHDNN